jgi:L,D-transpeptidase ErfK/SrfK
MHRPKLFPALASIGLAFTLLSSATLAATYPLPAPGDTVIGQMAPVELSRTETLLDVARRHSIGYQEIRRANPDVDPWLPAPDSAALLPTRYVLPDAPYEGILLNVGEMRLYYFPPPPPDGDEEVITFPVSIGRMDWNTPLGETKIVRKKADPTWTPPASIRKEHAAQGDILPDVVPAGPDNPLGQHALYLGRSGYLIHGTNRPYGIGMRVTHGCVRLYPEDVARLFELVPVGTPVNIINQPAKAGWQEGTLYLEVHPVLDENDQLLPPDLVAIRQVVTRAAGDHADTIDWSRVDAIAYEAGGIPVSLATRP